MFASSSPLAHSSRLNHRREVVPISSVRRETFLYSLPLIVLVLACALFYIWSRVQIVNVGYEINRKAMLKEELLEQNRKLILEAAVLKSPVRLEELAKNDFQMKLPEKKQILQVANLKTFQEEPIAKKEEIVKKRTTPKKADLETRKNLTRKQTQAKSDVSPRLGKKWM